ncbi:MAG TPA: carboxyltransferase domain-containing protein [Polyangiaceae bacterium]|jgi:allophanate hydrolase subunit 1
MNLGDGAIRVPLPPNVSPRAALAAARRWPGVVDAWLTDAWLAVEFESHGPPEIDLANLGDVLAPAPREHLIEVRYDGPDLADVARAAGLDPAEVVALHSRAEYTVLFLGFLPGFAYLGGLPRELAMPRLATPRVRVPKNAVAIGGAYAGVYPFESPGGWRIVGSARDVDLFDAERGALLAPGDRVRFRPEPR